jgi:hypothetical protein
MMGTYAGAAGMLLHINGKFTIIMGKLKSFLLSSSFVLNLFSLSMSRCKAELAVSVKLFIN